MTQTKRQRVRTYFTIAVFEDGKWGAEFGDWEMQFVEEELRDLRRKGHKPRELMVVRTNGMQKSVDEAIAILNSGRMTP